MSTILVITPLAIEHAALRHALVDLHGDADFQLAVGGHGKVEFALATAALVAKFKPRLVLAVGAAGALFDGVRAMDVVVGAVTLEHDFRLRFKAQPEPRFAGDGNTIAELKALQPFKNFKVHFGTIASGDEDIVDVERARALRLQTDALAVAWEGAGGARACRQAGVPYLEIRAVTDAADASAVEDFQVNVRRGMVHIAELLTAWRLNLKS